LELLDDVTAAGLSRERGGDEAARTFVANLFADGITTDEAMAAARQELAAGRLLSAMMYIRQRLGSPRPDDTQISTYTYQVAADLLLAIADRGAKGEHGPDVYKPPLLIDVMLQRANPAIYRSFSWLATFAHPNGFDTAPYKQLHAAIRAVTEEGDFDSRLDGAEGKNAAVCYLVFSDRLLASQLNQLLFRFRNDFHLKDYYTLFSTVRLCEIFDEVTLEILQQTLCGSLFLMQAAKAELPWGTIGKHVAVPGLSTRLLARHFSEALDGSPDDAIRNLFLYYAFHGFSSHALDLRRASERRTFERYREWLENKRGEHRRSVRHQGLVSGVRPRIAVCVSGQLRGFQEAAPTHRRLAEWADLKFYVHTWNAIGRRAPEPGHTKRLFDGKFLAAYDHALTVHGFAAVRQALPSLFSFLQNDAIVDGDALKALYRTDQIVIEDESDPRFAGWNNYDKMYYKGSACTQLALADTDTFDAIIRIRPDKIIEGFKPEFLAELLSTLRGQQVMVDLPIYLHHGVGHCIGDQFMLGAAADMIDLGDPYTEIETLKPMRMYCLNEGNGPHHNIANIVSARAVVAKEAPIVWGPLAEIQRPERSRILAALEKDATEHASPFVSELLRAIKADCGP
jgi:hypothetical protein